MEWKISVLHHTSQWKHNYTKISKTASSKGSNQTFPIIGSFLKQSYNWFWQEDWLSIWYKIMGKIIISIASVSFITLPRTVQSILRLQPVQFHNVILALQWKRMQDSQPNQMSQWHNPSFGHFSVNSANPVGWPDCVCDPAPQQTHRNLQV